VFCQQKLAEIYMAQARDYTNMVNYSEAEKAYRNAIAIAPGSAEAQLELAELISSAPARRDEAFALYREGLTYASKDPTLVAPDRLLEHRYNEAQLYMRESQHREAAELFWQVLQADDEGLYPRSTEFIVRALTSIRSQLIAENDENARALEILEGVVSRDPGRADAHYLLGRIYCDRENWEETVGRMELAVRALVGPNAGTDRAEARHCLAQAYRSAGRIQDAAVQLQALLTAQPTRYDALCELGEIYAIQLEPQRALAEFNKAIGVDPGIYRAYLGAARTQRQLFRYADALNNYKKLIELRGDHPAYFYEIGQTYADLNDHRSARQHLLKAIELIGTREGDNPSEESRLILSRAYTQLGLASVAERNYYEAIQSFDRALANYPDLAIAYDGKGQAYRELGQLEDAESFFHKALSQEPGNPQFLLNLGIFFHKFKKDRAGALPYYMKYFEHGGNDPQVRDWIRECGGTPPSVS
jgi:tetratricopeptide (TPR) repeat protein